MLVPPSLARAVSDDGHETGRQALVAERGPRVATEIGLFLCKVGQEGREGTGLSQGLRKCVQTVRLDTPVWRLM
jgi:hypothetical protein